MQEQPSPLTDLLQCCANLSCPHGQDTPMPSWGHAGRSAQSPGHSELSCQLLENSSHKLAHCPLMIRENARLLKRVTIT